MARLMPGQGGVIAQAAARTLLLLCACVWGCPWRPTLALPATHAKHALLHAVLGRAVLPAASVPALPGRAAQAVDQRSSWSSGDPLSAPPAPLVVVPAACSRLASRPQHAASMHCGHGSPHAAARGAAQGAATGFVSRLFWLDIAVWGAAMNVSVLTGRVVYPLRHGAHMHSP